MFIRRFLLHVPPHAWLPQDPALRSGRLTEQKIQARNRTRATQASGKGPKPRLGSAFRRSAYHNKTALPSLWREQLGLCRSIAHQSLQANNGTSERNATANRRYHKE